MHPETSVQFIKGVGPARAKLLANLGVQTVDDLLYLLPYRYEDRRSFIPIAQLTVGQWQTVMGEVVVGGNRHTFSSKQMVEVVVMDKTSRITAVWFNQPYLANYFKPGVKVVFYGKVDVFRNRLQIISPDFEIIENNDLGLHMGRIVPIYPLTKGIGQRYLRNIMFQCLKQYADNLKDVIPEAIRLRQGFLPIAKTIHQVHFPQSDKEQSIANDRVAFEEFFLFQIAVLLRRESLIKKTGIIHKAPMGLVTSLESSLSFKLTQAQHKAIDDILIDMGRAHPMLRLLQGDVGSGKTVVAFAGCVVAIENGYQAAIMAPTEILARQHFDNWKRLLSKGKFEKVRVELLISSVPRKEKEKILTDLVNGKIDLIIGTHALLEDDVKFKSLSLVVIDEQHKFGVNQRALLSAKAGKSPDVLIMTATPIPRTLCLTLYGDVDVSIINEMPPGRGTVKTYYFPTTQASQVYQKVRDWVKKGMQAYLIYPLVEESDVLELKSAKLMFDRLSQNEFKGLKIGLVHGQMPKNETEVLMNAFKNGEIDILVSTTILEVGIDVPNANIMIIEHAERFGLSQLHQLRGRIGRGKQNGICVLLGDPKTEDGTKRLEAIVSTTDGFKIAEQDLAIRGPGHYFGRYQHGLNELRVANPIVQMKLLETARDEAINLLKQDDQLKMQEHGIIRQTIQKRYPQYLELVLAG